jgi:hypothetical protein
MREYELAPACCTRSAATITVLVGSSVGLQRIGAAVVAVVAVVVPAEALIDLPRNRVAANVIRNPRPAVLR